MPAGVYFTQLSPDSHSQSEIAQNNYGRGPGRARSNYNRAQYGYGVDFSNMPDNRWPTRVQMNDNRDVWRLDTGGQPLTFDRYGQPRLATPRPDLPRRNYPVRSGSPTSGNFYTSGRASSRGGRGRWRGGRG
jgi:hypothetical protein